MGVMNNKRERMEDETIEYIERRRSTRIIALEEKKREEKEKKKALELERRKNIETRNKDKGKAKLNEEYELSDDDSSDEDEEQGNPNQYECKGEALKEGHNGSTSGKNVTVESIPEIIKTIIEVLQRDNPDMLFVAPTNVDVEGTSNPIVKQPMDFATMLARMYDDYYTTLDLFKRDVFLMCSNALSTNPANSRHYKVAKDMFAHARRIFYDINSEVEQFDLELSLNNKTPIRKQDSQRRTSRNVRATAKSVGIGKATVSEVENKNIHLTPRSNPTILTEFQHVYRPEIQFIQDPSNYKESLLKFVRDLGPIAQRVAVRKLQGIEFQQLLHPNPKSNVDSFVATNSASLNNRPLTLISDTSTQKNRNENHWHARSAALFANSFFNNANQGARNNNNGGFGVGVGGSSNERRTTLEIGNRFSVTPIPFKEGSSKHRELQFGNSRTVSSRVLPTIMISSAESGEGSSTGSSRRPPLIPSQQGSMPNSISFSDLSLQNQTRPTQTNLISSSILPQQMLMANSNVLRRNYNIMNNNNNNLNITRQQHGVMPQQVAHCGNELDTSMYSLGKTESFQALLGSSLDLNNSSLYQMQPNQNQFLHQAAPNKTPLTSQGVHPSQVMNLRAPPNLQQEKSIPSSQMNQIPNHVMNFQTPPNQQQSRPFLTNQTNQLQVPRQVKNSQTQPLMQQSRPIATNQMNKEPNQVMNRQAPSNLQQPMQVSTNQTNPVHSQVMSLRAPRQVPTPPVLFGTALIGGTGTSHDEDTDAIKFSWDVEDPPNLNLGL